MSRSYIRLLPGEVVEAAEEYGVAVTERFALAAIRRHEFRHVMVGRTRYTTPEWVKEWLDALPYVPPKPQSDQQVLAQ